MPFECLYLSCFQLHTNFVFLIYTTFNFLVVIWRNSIVFFRAFFLLLQVCCISPTDTCPRGKSDSLPSSYSLPPWFPQNKSISHWHVIIFDSLVLSLDQLHEGPKLVLKLALYLFWKYTHSNRQKSEATHTYTSLPGHRSATTLVTLAPKQLWSKALILQAISRCFSDQVLGCLLCQPSQFPPRLLQYVTSAQNPISESCESAWEPPDSFGEKKKRFLLLHRKNEADVSLRLSKQK